MCEPRGVTSEVVSNFLNVTGFEDGPQRAMGAMQEKL